MVVRQWRGGRGWEEIKRLGGGGQSEVFLVRNSERIAERKKHLDKIALLPNLPERLTFTNESVGPRDYMPPWAETEERLE